MNIDKLEDNIQSLVTNLNEKSFIYDLLLAYEQPRSSITRLKKGDYNLSKIPGEILWKKKLFFKEETAIDLHELIDKVKSDLAIIRHHPRFIIVTDFQTLLSVDTRTEDTLDIPVPDLAKYCDFFLPWAGMEKSQFQSENPADIKAAERMGRLCDLILEDNPAGNDSDRHALNIFLSRLLFCFFAEDTDIFADNQFTNAVASHTAQDGSDLQAYLQKLFKVLNLRERSGFPQFLNDLCDELEQAGNNKTKLTKLLARLYHLRIFDPACGSGNFLIIAYKELCKLEIKVFKRLYDNQLSFRFTSKINLSQFYGIELDDFAHETAKLSLWLAEHQMNLAFKEVFGKARPTLPLQDGGINEPG